MNIIKVLLLAGTPATLIMADAVPIYSLPVISHPQAQTSKFSPSPDSYELEKILGLPVLKPEIPKIPEGALEIRMEKEIFFIPKPTMAITPESLEMTWNEGGFVNYLSAGLYLADMEKGQQDSTRNAQRLKTWVKREKIRYEEGVVADNPDKDFSTNVSSIIKLHRNFDFHTNHSWSRTSFLTRSFSSVYDYSGLTNRLNFHFGDFVKGGLGYEMTYDQYKDKDYNQRTIGATPMGDVTFTPFKKNERLKTLALNLYTEVRNSRYREKYNYGDWYYEYDYDFENEYFVNSRSKTTGAGIHYEFFGVQVDPGVDFTNSIAD